MKLLRELLKIGEQESCIESLARLRKLAAALPEGILPQAGTDFNNLLSRMRR